MGVGELWCRGHGGGVNYVDPGKVCTDATYPGYVFA